MSTLHIFGDSFAEDGATSWTRLLADKFNFNLKNYARGGSCIEYSFLNLINHKKFNDNDIVLFVMTTPSRVATNKTIYDFPSTANNLTPGGVDQQFLDWSLKNIPKFMTDYKPTLYSSYILNLSIQYPRVKFVILKAFNFEIHGTHYTENFMVVDHTNLFKLSNAESKLTYNGQFNEIIGCDCRVNHFTNPNLKIMSEVVHDMIVKWDPAEFNVKKFRRGMIDRKFNTIDDIYTLFVNTGLLDKEFVDEKVRLYKNGFTKVKKRIWRLW